MSRRARILESITKEMQGIEIAPWFAPLTPKRDGFNCLVLDVFDGETLRKRAAADPNISEEGVDQIEDVDLIGSATEIASLVPTQYHGKFDYIVSSHNFEHLPNPINFLRGCQILLKEGGILSMAVPDGRACFDFFRPHTTTIDWLVAFRDKLTKPSAEQIFVQCAYYSAIHENDELITAFSLQHQLTGVKAIGDLYPAYQYWLNAPDSGDYVDAHCSVMTPASFELLIYECRCIGLISLDIQRVSDIEGCEFYVQLVNRPNAALLENVNAKRTELMHKIWNERALAATSKMSQPPIIAAAVEIVQPASTAAVSFRKKLSVKYFHPLKRSIRGFLARSSI